MKCTVIGKMKIVKKDGKSCSLFFVTSPFTSDRIQCDGLSSDRIYYDAAAYDQISVGDDIQVYYNRNGYVDCIDILEKGA